MRPQSNDTRARTASLPPTHESVSARARSTSAPTQPVHLTQAARLASARSRWQESLRQAEGLIDKELLDALRDFESTGSRDLDLSAHGNVLLALGRSSTAKETAILEDVMTALASLCAENDLAPTSLVCPPGLRKLPAWVAAFDTVIELRLPQFRGKELDARHLEALKLLDLGEMLPREMVIRTPPKCRFTVTHPDGRLPTVQTVERENHQRIQLKSRPLNFNGRIHRDSPNNPKDMFVCRHLSLGKLQTWAVHEPLQLAMEPSGVGPAVKEEVGELIRSIPTDADEICSKLDHRPRQAFLVAHAQWGTFAHHQFAQMQRDGRAVATAFVVVTSCHAMAMRFDATEPNRPRIELWDPNFTAISTFSHEPFEFDAMFVDFELVNQSYFGVQGKGKNLQPLGTARHIKIVMIDDPLNPMGSVAPDLRSSSMSVEFAGLPGYAHPDMVRELVEHGVSRLGIEQVVKAIESLELTPAQCIALLTAADGHHIPALSRAMDTGHSLAFSDTALLLVAAFKRGLIKEADVKTVLEGFGPYGAALTEAYRSGHHAAVTDFVRAVTQLFKAGALKEPRLIYHLVRAANTSRSPTIHFVKDLKTAQCLEKGLRKLLKAGALKKEQYKDLLEELTDRQKELHDEAKARKREAKRAPVINPTDCV